MLDPAGELGVCLRFRKQGKSATRWRELARDKHSKGSAMRQHAKPITHSRLLFSTGAIAAALLLLPLGYSATAQDDVRGSPKAAIAGQNPIVPLPALPGEKVIDGVPCSQITRLGIDKQMNLRAARILVGCGRAVGGSTSPGSVIAPEIAAGAAGDPRQHRHRHWTRDLATRHAKRKLGLEQRRQDDRRQHE